MRDNYDKRRLQTYLYVRESTAVPHLPVQGVECGSQGQSTVNMHEIVQVGRWRNAFCRGGSWTRSRRRTRRGVAIAFCILGHILY